MTTYKITIDAHVSMNCRHRSETFNSQLQPRLGQSPLVSMATVRKTQPQQKTWQLKTDISQQEAPKQHHQEPKTQQNTSDKLAYNKACTHARTRNVSSKKQNFFWTNCNIKRCHCPLLTSVWLNTTMCYCSITDKIIKYLLRPLVHCMHTKIFWIYWGERLTKQPN